MDVARYPSPYAAPQKHHPLIIALHWGTVLAMVISVAAVLLREVIEDSSWRRLLLESHRQLGLIVFFCVALRIGIRLRFGMADHMGDAPQIMRLAAGCAHWGLYGLMIGLPLLGWASTNAHNLPVGLLGIVDLPALVGEDSELADQLSDFHLLGAWALLGLSGVHASAALYHHLVRRDRVLWAMLPGRTATAVSMAAATPVEAVPDNPGL